MAALRAAGDRLFKWVRLCSTASALGHQHASVRGAAQIAQRLLQLQALGPLGREFLLQHLQQPGQFVILPMVAAARVFVGIVIQEKAPGILRPV
jgi:hypothetical protein